MPICEAWMKPFADVGATVVVSRNTGSTDHISFDRVGLPGFQFVQDRLDYGTNVHHTNLDTYDHTSAQDLKQAAATVASVVYHAAMRETQMPRSEQRRVGKECVIRVDLGGRRLIKKKKIQIHTCGMEQ